MVDDFEICYVGSDHADHLMNILKMNYEKSQKTRKENYTGV